MITVRFVSLRCTIALVPLALTGLGLAQSTAPLPQAPASAPAPVPAPQPSAPLPQAPAVLPDAPSTTAHTAAPAMPTGATVLFDTSMGRLTCQLFEKEAPETTANFLGLVMGTKPYTDAATHREVTGKRFYDGTQFHRVIPGFMIQGGDPLANGTGDAGYYIPDEISPSLRFDVPGRLAMANSGPNTNSSQFFITEVARPDLNGHYTIFGQCDPHSVLIVASIARVERNSEDKPYTPVMLDRVLVVPPGTPMPADPSQSAQPAPAPKPAPVPVPPAPVIVPPPASTGPSH